MNPSFYLKQPNVQLSSIAAVFVLFPATYSVQACDDSGLGSGWDSVADVVAKATNRLMEIVRPLDAVTGKFLRLTTPQTR